MSNAKRRPDYLLQATLREPIRGTAKTATVGAAWKTKSRDNVEGLSVRLNVGVVLDWKDPVWLTLWPNDAGGLYSAEARPQEVPIEEPPPFE